MKTYNFPEIVQPKLPDMTNLGITISLFNGPPGSGKDSICNELNRITNDTASTFKFADPLVYGIKSLFRLSNDEFQKFYYEEKDIPQERLYGQSFRDLQIWLSEVVLKPRFSTSFFGVNTSLFLAEVLRNLDKKLWFCSDSGFSIEANILTKVFGPENIFVFRLEREGTNFFDSRSYWPLEESGIPKENEYFLENNSTVPDAATFVTKQLFNKVYYNGHSN